jgi:cyclopropane-fatty-acyl-phospholipid synthase
MSSWTTRTTAPAAAASMRDFVAGRMLRRLAGPLACGQLAIETPADSQLAVTGTHPGPHARLRLHSWRSLSRMMVGGDIGFAEAFIEGEVSTPDLATLLAVAARNADLLRRLEGTAPARIGRRLLHALNRNTRRGSKRNISAHYDLGNSFYAHWLDAGMTYSSALFTSPAMSLEDAQAAKLDRVLDLLDVRDGDRVLEIGCGWGSFAERALDRTSCTLTGITLSAEQLLHARRRLARTIANGRCDLRLQDYRDVAGAYDRIVSIEMLEAVGTAYWPGYFAQLRQCLRPGGTAVLQVITIDARRFERYARRPDFIQKHIFPGGMLPTKEIIARHTAGAGLTPVTQQFFGADYARTLNQWSARFRSNWPEIRRLGFDDRFRRMWEYYLAYCQVGFEIGALDVGLYKISRPD